LCLKISGPYWQEGGRKENLARRTNGKHLDPAKNDPSLEAEEVEKHTTVKTKRYSRDLLNANGIR